MAAVVVKLRHGFHFSVFEHVRGIQTASRRRTNNAEAIKLHERDVRHHGSTFPRFYPVRTALFFFFYILSTAFRSGVRQTIALATAPWFW